MSRSKWKGAFFDNSIYKILIKKIDIKKPLKITSRKSTIISDFLGKVIQVYNGKNFIERRVTPEMIGHKFGSISYTRAKYEYKKNKKK